MIEKFAKDRTLTLKNLLDALDPQFLGNTPDWRNLYTKKTEKDVIIFFLKKTNFCVFADFGERVFCKWQK